jgi:uncharacterized membrane protein YozB (DUF420 family)
MIGPDDLPGVNAILNSTCVVLLVAGYATVRARRLTLHKSLMLSALAVSAVFLTSYLYYHFAVKHGQPTYFRDRAPAAPNWVANAYTLVLVSHTILAALAAPLALTTAGLGLGGRWTWHKRLARWTLPIWLYVSVTGVVVYWMLYRLYPSP